MRWSSWILVSLTVSVLTGGCHDRRLHDASPDSYISPAGMIRTPEELRVLYPRARRNDVSAIHTLIAHYFGSDDRERGQYWLRKAARLGDCHALELLQDRVFNSGLAASEIQHWRAEFERLGCDPMSGASR